MEPISDRAFRLILNFEGLNQPGKWPGGDSGITIGIGYDLGYTTVDRFESDWGAFLGLIVRERLKKVVGFRGVAAKNRAPELADITINRADSEQVFRDKTLPLTVAQTVLAFPGIEALPADAQGALVSLVYNRGTSMVDASGDKLQRCREMRAIRDAVALGDFQDIANQLRAMKRLWVNKGLDGLLKRRDAEAALVESSIG